MPVPPEVSTPFKETGRAAACCKLSAWLLAGFLLLVSIWSFLKIPYMGYNAMTNVTYDAAHCAAQPQDPACYGFEIQASLRAWIGFRGQKMHADYALFVAPHTAMAIVLNCMFASLLIRGFGVVQQVAKVVWPIAAIFALHVCPVSYGLPGTSVNAACIVLMFFGCAAVRYGLKQHKSGRPVEGDWVLFFAMVGLAIVLNAAPLGEIFVLAGALPGTKNATTGLYIGPEGDRPDDAFGHSTHEHELGVRRMSCARRSMDAAHSISRRGPKRVSKQRSTAAAQPQQVSGAQLRACRMRLSVSTSEVARYLRQHVRQQRWAAAWAQPELACTWSLSTRSQHSSHVVNGRSPRASGASSRSAVLRGRRACGAAAAEFASPARHCSACSSSSARRSRTRWPRTKRMCSGPCRVTRVPGPSARLPRGVVPTPTGPDTTACQAMASAVRTMCRRVQPLRQLHLVVAHASSGAGAGSAAAIALQRQNWPGRAAGSGARRPLSAPRLEVT